MAKFVIGVLIVVFALVLLTAVVYRWFESREATKRQKMKLDHERQMKREEQDYDEFMAVIEDDE